MTGPSTTETWDAFFSDFYLRAFAADERDDEAEAQALAGARPPAARAGDLLDVPWVRPPRTFARARRLRAVGWTARPCREQAARAAWPGGAPLRGGAAS